MLRDRLTEALKDAMRAKDQASVDGIRLIIAKLKEADINARPSGKEVGDAEILSLMQGMIKQRRESITMFEKGGRAELAAKEQGEIDVISRFLPKQMDDAAIAEAIKAAVAKTGAASVKDMGKVMAELKANYAGQMDFAQAGPAVKAALGG